MEGKEEEKEEEGKESISIIENERAGSLFYKKISFQIFLESVKGIGNPKYNK